VGSRPGSFDQLNRASTTVLCSIGLRNGRRPADGRPPEGPIVPREAHKIRLANIIGWVQTAKEILPALNEGSVTADRIAQMSALLDRMHRIAVALQRQVGDDQRRRAA
jgi:hypothetical protein